MISYTHAHAHTDTDAHAHAPLVLSQSTVLLPASLPPCSPVWRSLSSPALGLASGRILFRKLSPHPRVRLRTLSLGSHNIQCENLYISYYIVLTLFVYALSSRLGCKLLEV